MNVGELIMYIGFKADTIKLNEFVHAVSELNLSSVLASLGVKELYDGLKSVIDIADKSALEMNIFTSETGLSAQKMEQWTRYAEKFGVAGDTVANALTTIQKKATGLKLGTDSSLLTPLYLLNQAGAGITNADLNNPFVFLNKALAALQKVNPELRTTIAGMLGINEQLLTIKSFAGADGIRVLSPDNVQELNKMHSSLVDLGNEWKNVFEEIGASFVPMLDGLAKAADWLTKLTRDSADFQNLLGGLAIGFAAVWAASLGPLGAVVFLVSSLLALLGQLVHYWPQIQEKISGFGVNFKNILGGFANPHVLSTGGATGSWQVTQHNTFHIASNDPHAVARAVDDRLSQHLDNAKRQQPNSSR